MATLTTLQPETVTKLQNLLQIAIESAQGFEAINAANKGNKQVSKVFQGLAKERKAFAEQLKQYVDWTPGQTIGINSVEQWWNDAPNQAASDLPQLLSNVVSAENEIASIYSTVVEDTIGTPAHDALVQQHEAVEKAAQQINTVWNQISK